MKNIIVIDGRRFLIEPDSSLIRNEELYCVIKDKINKREVLPNNGIDWQSIRVDGELLAESLGLDLIIASYYTVAAFKTQGYNGFASGLSLINASLLMQREGDLKQKKLNRGLVDWVKNQVVKDIRKLQPNYEMLRDLYRCERECQILEEVIDPHQESNESCFEDVAIEVLKHIERLEMRYHTIDKVRLKMDRFSWNDATLVLASSIISVIFTFVFMTYLPK